MSNIAAMLSKRTMAPRPQLERIESTQLGISSPRADVAINLALRNAVNEFSIPTLVKLLLHEVEHVDYKKKKERYHLSSDHEVLQKILHEMKEMLNYKFLNVDLSDPVLRNISNTDWSHISACKRSEAGTTGIYFLQCEDPSHRVGAEIRPSVVVSKPVQADEFEKHELVNRMTTDFFYIRCPQIRLVKKEDKEYKEIETGVINLFSHLEAHKDMYRSGGKSSPRGLFGTSALMLMELVKGKPLCHRLAGQRELMPADYRAIGRLFLLDLLIRNTDRLPCRKAMPRPGSNSIANQGNAGNVMFGDIAGSVWAIDPEMQTKISQVQEASYKHDFHSVVNEIVHGHAMLPQYVIISKLFFERVDFLEGILDASLDETEAWETKSDLQQAGIHAVLQLIRVRAAAYDNFVINNSTNGKIPPIDNNEKDWREWIRMAVPRAILDIIEFVETHTGYIAPPSAARNIEMGFLESMSAARKMRKELANPFSLVGSYQKFLAISMNQQSEEGISFILRLVDSLKEFDSFLPDYPRYCCDEVDNESKPVVVNMSAARKKMRDAVHRIAMEKRKMKTSASIEKMGSNDNEDRVVIVSCESAELGEPDSNVISVQSDHRLSPLDPEMTNKEPLSSSSTLISRNGNAVDALPLAPSRSPIRSPATRKAYDQSIAESFPSPLPAVAPTSTSSSMNSMSEGKKAVRRVIHICNMKTA